MLAKDPQVMSSRSLDLGRAWWPHRHNLPACVDTGPWTGPEEMVLELVGRLFSLLGQLPIIPQQTLRSTLLKET